MKLLPKMTLSAMVVGGISAGIYAAPDVGGGGSGLGQPTAFSGARMSVAEMHEKVRSMNERIQGDFRLVMHMQSQARKSKDVIRLNCVNDKLVQLKPYLNLFDRDRTSMEAISDDSRYVLFEEMNGHSEAVRRLREEADRCAGDSALTGESSNGWTGPRPPDDPFGNPFGPGVEPPAYASPYN